MKRVFAMGFPREVWRLVVARVICSSFCLLFLYCVISALTVNVRASLQVWELGFNEFSEKVWSEGIKDAGYLISIPAPDGRRKSLTQRAGYFYGQECVAPKCLRS